MSEILNPKDEKISISNWWDYHHKSKGNYQYWLTGSSGPEVWKYLNISRLIKPNRVVLNIGVGIGHCTKKLVTKKCRVHALDISPSALEKVAAITEKTWLPAALPDVPKDTFDLAISNLVTQHMADADLTQQISHVVRALKVNGVFAMQFAYIQDPAKNDVPIPEEETIKVGGVGRSLEGMLRLVKQAGGNVVWAERIALFPGYNSGWYAIHIVRPDFSLTNLSVVSFNEKVVRKIKQIGRRFAR